MFSFKKKYFLKNLLFYFSLIFTIVVASPLLNHTQQNLSFAQQETEDKYKQEMRKLQKEIEMLKLKILETKKSLKIFEDMIQLGTLTGTKITIYLKDELKDAEIQEVSVVLDGFEVSNIREDKKIEQAKKEKVLIYDESEAIPGKHIVDIVLTIKTNRIFKKTLRYEFDVESGIATVIYATVKRAPGKKKEVMPEDIDITVFSEKVRLITKE
jgi:aspartate-semialdehyde dehydrogenase